MRDAGIPEHMMTTETTAAPAGAEGAAASEPSKLSILDMLDDDDAAQQGKAPEGEEPDAEPADEPGATPSEAVGDDEDDTSPKPDDEDDELPPAEDEKSGAEPEPKKPADDGYAKAEQKVRLRDGSERTVGDLKRAGDEVLDLRQQLAEQPRALAAEKAELTRHQQTVQQLLPLAMQVLQKSLPPQPDPALINTDPIQYLQDKAHFDQAVGELQGMQAAVLADQQRHQQVSAEQRQAQAQQFEGYKQTQRAKLLEVLPELSDPARAQEFAADYRKYGVETFGFTPEELASAFDHRLFRMFSVAVKGLKAEEAAQKAKATAQAKVADKPPVKTPVQAPAGRVSTAERERQGSRGQLERLRKTGSPKDAEAFLSRFE